MNVVVTGASKGIGKAIAEIFAANGHTIFICARHKDMLEQTAASIQKKYKDIAVHSFAADLSEKDQVVEFGQWVLKQCTPDILVNNAGHFVPGNTYNEEDGILKQQLDTNLLSAYHLTRTLLPGMIDAGNGHVFNICSIASLRAYPGGGSYGISKFALDGFTKNLREEMKTNNIKVTAVYPGAVLTSSWAGFDNSTQRIMEADDIAKMVFAASQLSKAACVEEIVIRPQLGDL